MLIERLFIVLFLCVCNLGTGARARYKCTPGAHPQVNAAAKGKTHWESLQVSDFANKTAVPSLYTPSGTSSNDKKKSKIRMNLGDPTLAGNLPPSNATISALLEAANSLQYNGYGFSSAGVQEAREAIVRHFSTPEAPFTSDDVVLGSGCSHALEMSISAIAGAGDNILIPRPGFPLYLSLCRPLEIDGRYYRINLQDGLVDLKDMERLIDANTKAILVNNPSNPAGVAFPKEHLEAILKIAFKYKLTIIADEIYGDLVYSGAKFYPMASLSPKVPIIVCDGISKRYVVPGWRMGWLIVHNRYDVLTDVKTGILSMSQRLMGPNMLVQGALPHILDQAPELHLNRTRFTLERNAQIAYKMLSAVEGLRPLKPNGAIYIMVYIDPNLYGNEIHFIDDLIKEESLFVTSCSMFGLKNWVRLVLFYPEDVMIEACARITEYSKRKLTEKHKVIRVKFKSRCVNK